MTTLLLLGHGYTAGRLLDRHSGAFSRVVATVRGPEKTARLRAQGIDAFAFDGGAVTADLAAALRRVTHAVSSVPPGTEGPADPALEALAPHLSRAENLAFIGYLSTTGVYGDHGGGWVHEGLPAAPSGPRGRRRLGAEEAWRTFGRALSVPVTAFRLPGIYGPGRNTLVQLREGVSKRVVKPGQVFSRIHVDDLADQLAAALRSHAVPPALNIADDEPAPPEDVVVFAAGLLGIEPPPAVPFEEAALSPMARSFWAESKRTSNRLMTSALATPLAYPTYREGLAALAAAGEGR